jgi:hypothetical protein
MVYYRKKAYYSGSSTQVFAYVRIAARSQMTFKGLKLWIGYFLLQCAKSGFRIQLIALSSIENAHCSHIAKHLEEYILELRLCAWNLAGLFNGRRTFHIYKFAGCGLD